MGLSTLIKNAKIGTVSDDQGDWRQFVLDHLDYIQARSQSFSIEPELINLYRYDLERFLREYMKRNQDITWIVQLLNDIPNDFDFDESMIIVVPTDSLITNLYQSYTTVVNNPG
jgi:hypothetical protein